MNNFAQKTFRSNLLMLALVAVTTLTAHSALSQESEPQNYRMAVISDQAFGEELVSGNYADVIPTLEKKTSRYHRFAAVNNLCVAYIMANDANNAMRVCENAVTVSHRKSLYSSTLARVSQRMDKAIALSNRGVARALTGNAQGAKKDFETAIELKSDFRDPAHNLHRLEAKMQPALANL